jgi:hypothetical protein
MKILPVILIAVILSSCVHGLDPAVNQEIQNPNGHIEELKNNQNGINAELGKLRQDFAGAQTATAEKINKLEQEQQQGLVNKSNRGVQILQGDGPIILIFGLGAIWMVLHYRQEAAKHEKTADIIAKTVADKDDGELNHKIMLAAENTGVESEVTRLMLKHGRHGLS